ncbi:hypothetical protein YC2023_022855 [Brassica napus]
MHHIANYRRTCLQHQQLMSTECNNQGAPQVHLLKVTHQDSLVKGSPVDYNVSQIWEASYRPQFGGILASSEMLTYHVTVFDDPLLPRVNNGFAYHYLICFTVMSLHVLFC